MQLTIRFGVAVFLAAAMVFGSGAKYSVSAKPSAIPFPIANPKRASTRASVKKLAPKTASQDKTSKNDRKSFDFTAAFKPLLDYKLSAADRKNLKSAISLVYKQRFNDARAARKRVKDKDAQKLALWYYYRSRGLDAKADEIENFRRSNPEWPSQRRLRRNAERALFLQVQEAKTIKEFFARSAPETGAGIAALAKMHIAEGAKERGAAMIRKAWRNHTLAKQIEVEILKRYSAILTTVDHKARVDRLLFKDRKSRIAPALRTAKLLSKDEQKKIEARVAIVRRSKTAEKLLKAIPENSSTDDVGIYFSRIQWLRRNDRDEEAWTLLRNAPQEPDQLLDLGEWWVERRVNCRTALNTGYPKIAYEIASNHGPLSGRHYAEAEFLAGWIALRFLNQPETALKHFLALRTSSLSPEQIARAEYWLGRTAEASNDEALAQRHFTHASLHKLTYYGQLSKQALTGTPSALHIPKAPLPTPADVKKFLSHEAVKAIGIARAAGLEKLTPLFFHQLARTLSSPAEIVLLAELAQKIGQPHASVRLGKIALNRGHPVAEYAYPVGLLPDYKKINGTVEPAFLHALSRQESEFNPKARSPVGARGLMQLMPRTARAVARQHKVRYRKNRLTSDPSYNMMLGAAHLRDLLDKYSSSYILSLVAYNAGGGRVTKWTEQFGDPRNADVDPIDWVEQVPFTETRLYIQKILTTMQIFRSRLNGPDTALQLVQDLNKNESPKTAEEVAKAAATASPSTSN